MAKKEEPSMKQLQAQYDFLKKVESNLILEIEKLKKRQPYSQTINIGQIRQPIPIPLSTKRDIESLDELDKCLKFTQNIENFKFFNEIIEYLPTLDDDYDNILYKKFYKTDCRIDNDFTFHIEFLVHEMLNKNEIIKSINVQVTDPMQMTEMQKGLNVLKKKKKLRPLYESIKQYVELNEQRKNVINNLPQQYFEIKQMKDGYYEVMARDMQDNQLFTVKWFIDWIPAICNYMHSFEITTSIDDIELDRALNNHFELLCAYCEDSSKALTVLNEWDSIVRTLENYFDYDPE